MRHPSGCDRLHVPELPQWHLQALV
jgi:hypothetical protein